MRAVWKKEESFNYSVHCSSHEENNEGGFVLLFQNRKYRKNCFNDRGENKGK